MPQYLTPGVYIEEVLGSPPIVGIGVSTPGFIGHIQDLAGNGQMPERPPRSGETPPVYYDMAPAADANPPGDPVLITSWDQFQTKFGLPQAANSTLAHSVYGFFVNGGTRCYVARITGDITDATVVGNVLRRFEKIDEIGTIAVPGSQAADVQNAVVTHCTNMKDRFAILDGLENPATIDYDTIRNSTNISQYAALYFPWLKVPNLVNDPAHKTIFVPPSGYLAGIYARVDAERGVHKAPANEVVQGISALEYQVSRNEQDGLNPKGINVIRYINGSNRVWGARTLGGNQNGEFIYVNVRRTMNFLRRSIDQGTQWVVFEPNNPALWKRIIRSVHGFLLTVWRDGALFGNTPEQAFWIKCDESNNPPELRDLGQVVIDIGVAIVRPAEFVVFRVAQIPGSAS